MDDLTVKLRQELSKYRKRYGVNRCLICKKENPKFCNSHTVPRFILNNIAENGLLKQSIYLMTDISIGIMDESKGINSTGTFKNICIDCDSKIFSEYENPENIIKMPTQKMLLQIALKNMLYNIDKKYYEKGTHEFTIEKLGVPNLAAKHHQIDFEEDLESFNRLLKGINGKKNIEFEVFFWAKLDYVVPVAFQGPVTLYSDLNGYVVNDVYDKDYRHFMQNINICVFPLESYSIVMAFNDKSYSKNYNFIKQFKEKTFNEKLYIINYIIMAYTEDYFLSSTIAEMLKENDNLTSLCSNMNFVTADVFENINPNDKQERLNELKNMMDIPNLLAEEYKLR